jgi:hypothetical protein
MDASKKDWEILAELASRETNAEKLVKLVQEITRLLDREARERQNNTEPPAEILLRD